MIHSISPSIISTSIVIENMSLLGQSSHDLENVGAVNIKSDRLYIRTAEKGPIENGDINIETINGQCILPLDISYNDQISHQSVSRRSVSFFPCKGNSYYKEV